MENFEKLGMAFAKKAMGQKLSKEEEALIAENSAKLLETAKAVKSEAKKADEEAEKNKVTDHEASIKTFVEDRVQAVINAFNNAGYTGAEAGTKLKADLKALVSDCPVLKKGKVGTGTGNSSGMAPKTGAISADSYAGICKATLIAAKGPVSFTALESAVHKAKPESSKLNSTGKEPLSTVYIKRVPKWFPNVTVTGTGKKASYTWK